MSSLKKDPGAERGPATEVFEELQRGVAGAEERFFDLIHGELKRLAASFMNRQRVDHTLQPTALVNEAYLKLMGGAGAGWNDRTHFMRASARAMRTILVDMARAHATEKRGAGRLRITLGDGTPGEPEVMEDVVAVHEALEKLEQLDPEWARLVELRFFAGLGPEEAAAVMGTSPATVHRTWNHARAWLYRELGG